MIKLTFLKELILIREVHEKSVTFMPLCIFYITNLSLNNISVISIMKFDDI